MSISSSQGIKPLCLMAPNNDPPDKEYLISFSLQKESNSLSIIYK